MYWSFGGRVALHRLPLSGKSPERRTLQARKRHWFAVQAVLAQVSLFCVTRFRARWCDGRLFYELCMCLLTYEIVNYLKNNSIARRAMMCLLCGVLLYNVLDVLVMIVSVFVYDGKYNLFLFLL